MKPATHSMLMTPAEVARRMGVSPITVRSWVTKGWLHAHITPGGHRRFFQGEVERFAAEHAQNPKRVLTASRPRILIVDDDVKFRDFVSEAVQLLLPDAEIREAGDGFQAGMAMAEFRPALVLLDYMMPGLDGVEVCQLIKGNADHVHTRVIAITGLSSPETSDALISAGADRVLFKPIRVHVLNEIVQEFASDLARQRSLLAESCPAAGTCE